MASEEQELEWIEQPGGWEGDSESQDDTKNDTKHDNDECDGEENEFGGFDLFAAETNPESTFPFDVSLSGGEVVRLRLEGFTLDSDETAQSTGVTLWQAAPRLANYITETTVAETLIRGKSVLELGAGLGLCGMVAHHLGAEKVVLTDADTITLQRMRTNLENNCPRNQNNNTATGDENSISCGQLIWKNMSQMEDCGDFDTILGADVIYTIESLDPLFDTVAFFLRKDNKLDGVGVKEGDRCFILSRHTKYGDISDETVLDAARTRNLVWTRPSDGIFVFRQGTIAENNHNDEQS